MPRFEMFLPPKKYWLSLSKTKDKKYGGTGQAEEIFKRKQKWVFSLIVQKVSTATLLIRSISAWKCMFG